MAYGILKCDNITFDNGGSDQNVTVSGLYRATTSGVTVSGTIAATTVSGVTVIGSTTVSGATVTGTTANFTSGNFSNIISSAATMSGALIMANQQQVRFREAVGNGVNHIALQAPAIVSADQTITLPDQTGTVVTTGDNGSVSSTMLATNLTISAAAGSATTPSIAFTGDLNTGIYSPGADQLAVSTGGTGRLFVDASGNVGIGTGSPSYLLHVNTAAATDVELAVQNSAGLARYGTRTSGNAFAGSFTAGKSFELWSANAQAVTIDSSNRVGIGTSSPWSPGILDCFGNAKFGASSTNGLYLGIVSGTPYIQGYNTTTPSSSVLAFYGGGGEAMRIDSSGRLLVGTSSARSNVYVTTVATTPQVEFDFNDNSYNAGVSLINYSGTGFAPALTLGLSQNNTRGTNAALNSGVDMGIINFVGNDGTNFRTGATITAATDATTGTGDMPGRLTFNTTADGASSPTERLRIDSSGRVGIGTSSPTAKTEIASSGSESTLILRNTSSASSTYSELKFAPFTGTTAASASIRTTYTQDNNSTLEFRTTSAAAEPVERMRIDSSGRVGIGTSSPGAKTEIVTTTNGDGLRLSYDNTPLGGTGASLVFTNKNNASTLFPTASIKGIITNGAIGSESGGLTFNTATGGAAVTERMRIGSDGYTSVTTNSFYTGNGSTVPLQIERTATDGTLVQFYQASTVEGEITVSGTTVSYVGGHLARWSQLPDNEDPSQILKGTVMSNLDEMCEWGEEDNEQLNKTQISNIEGDKNVAGVFVSTSFSEDGPLDFFVGMTGDMVVRITEGVTVERGDLLMSAGDGTAKPQGDDIIRSKTIAKVTSTVVSCTYEDGSYCVPCVLMAC